ncbi:hypothetical protein IBE11_03795 [Francisella tularensis subsp. novicida]|uniref:hypothetical protein n=1 Tax=Francisella tularensis TaxID=263 RepID=UPI000501F174|nr:hypothetical protein [Francisella tularensis]AJJ46409.1 hypothetical protein CH70_1232 [Francisella tularensis subsp. novicida]KFJ66799.1 hypothetical protein DR83_1192 [Francisella tularensis subsp. novicida]MBK2344834.1 hypothetical protein [Francisella tularensis subsp. novicida]MBK2349596.1 hypothetical protein [Francisella tularensis subsp. novicida]MBK2353156.1 hypothetical protein [Francisella tularensis subsp. novicida]
MDLKDFIKETITQIGESIMEIQEHFDSKNIDAIVNPREIDKSDFASYSATYSATGINFKGEKYTKKDVSRIVDNIEFDVAITVEQDDKKGIGGKLKVFGAGIGAEANQINKLANVSTVKFKIPFVMPHGRENKS